MAGASSRYELLTKLASGGMATVYVGRVRGPLGFSRLVAIKRAHPHLLEDEGFARMLVDEAKLASRIHNPHVVAVLDIERHDRGAGSTDLRLVMEYVEGASLADLTHLAEERGRPMPAGLVVRIVLDACAGLQVAHDLTDEKGQKLGIVHRDVSPHNLLVGVDGLTRVSDFGIAKETAKPSATTTTGSLKGKLAYMAPEYVMGGEIDARADVFAIGVVAWESLAGRRLFRAATEVETLQRVASAEVPALSSVKDLAAPSLDDVLAAALSRLPGDRFSSVRAFANALEAEAKVAGLVATHAEVAAWVRDLAGPEIEARRAQVREAAQRLDAARTGGTTQDALRVAVDSAKQIVDAEASAGRSVDATLDGSGVSSASVAALGASRSRAHRASPMRWFALAAVLGVGAAAALLGLRAPEPRVAPSTSGAALGAAPPPPPGAEVPPPPATPPASASASASTRPSAAAPPAAAPSGPVPRATVPRQPVGPAPPGPTIAPNPYRP